MNLDKLCDYFDCNCKDFLQFQCKLCNKNYCINHRTFEKHFCQNIKNINIISIECPKCNLSIKMHENEDINDKLKIHFISCNGIPKSNLKKCSKKNCKNLLTISNTFQCKHCNENVCLTHRIQEDHLCKKLFNNQDVLDVFEHIGINVLMKNMKT